ncbi:MAG TPA: branched-chain amino acid ABC transporter permease, partial [Rhodobacteraceae bacterium]|nr:branched-chain amino acid ABC transporter permease [Paracoccaceae bacterium]
MNDTVKNTLLFAGIAILIVGTGFVQSWNSALLILNMGLISAIMALGVNLQWGFAGLFNTGIMGFVALGGLASVLISTGPVPEAWPGPAFQAFGGLILGAITMALAVMVWRKMPKGRNRGWAVTAILVLGFILFRAVFDP